MFFKNKFVIIFLFCFFITNAHSIELIRDVELEEFTKEIMLPLTRSSNLEDNRIDLYFINSNEVNAFVTAGQRIFINTELIIQSKTYAEYLGVIAHELAHINAGHISRTKNQITELAEKSMPIYLLGILGILGGETDVPSLAATSEPLDWYLNSYKPDIERSAKAAFVVSVTAAKAVVPKSNLRILISLKIV